jgi:PBSX family phage terminase large subunit
LTPPKKTYKLTDKQKEAALVMSKNRTTLLEGGGRAGKTFIFLRAICKRALDMPSPHLVTRFRFNHAKQSICYQTMPNVIDSLNLNDYVNLNKSDWFYEFKNGSTIWIGGIDDKERTEKILGNEYATIFYNEASQISYESYEMVRTRLNFKGLTCREFIDYNPPSIHHWGYKMFHKRMFPDGRPVPDDDYAWLQMNPKDNMENLSPEYLDMLNTLSEAKRKRFLLGEYSLDSGKLWKRDWIKYTDTLPDMERIVVGVDPTGSVGGDEAGIIVAGKANGCYYVLDDYSLHGTPNEWAAEVIAAYNKHMADLILAEKNYGGDMVEATIKNVEPSANVELVSASRGKVVRAEPISALYEQGKVFHRTPFYDLEDEMCLYDPEESASPNRMDALVWCLTELADLYSVHVSDGYLTAERLGL